MRLIRGLGGALLWVVSLLLGLVALILCLTVILLPLGIPLLGYSRRTFALGLKLMLPRAVSHPVHRAEKSAHKGRHKAKKSLRPLTADMKRLRRRRHSRIHKLRKRLPLVS
jgi:hypothetical protein